MSNARDTAKNLKTGLNVAAAGSIIDVQKNGSTVGQISNIGNDFVVGSSTGSGAGLRFDGTNNMMYASNSLGSSRDNAVSLGASSVRFKDLYLSGGVYLGGTGAANKLEDVEEGTWTPSFYSGFSSISAYTYQVGHYIKIGALVYTDFYLYFTGTGNNAHISVTGLPFTLSTQHSGLVRGGGISTYNNISSVIQQFYGQGSTDRFNLYYNGNSGAGVSGTQTNKYLIGIFTYKTDA